MTDSDQTGTNGMSGAAGTGSADAGGSTSGTTPPTGGDESFGWTGEEPAGGGSDTRATAERMLGQLQSMIDTIAVQAAPVVRQIGAKAAELAAVAADRAGPLAHRAADATADASVRLAERSRTLAADLRSKADGATGDGASDSGGSNGGAGSAGGPSDYTTTPLSGADDASEMSAKDDPAEGRPL